jgi:ABC-type polysaccharide/polyol phosphate transport system ATPase subunit
VSSLSVSNTHKTNEIAVSVRDVSLTYSTTIDRRPTFKTRVKALARGKKQTRVVQALRNVNLDVEYGHVLGVIGANGAGKSSLMRCIAGILPPSQGRIEVYGSVSTLLALGVGFNPSMSGRDNVYLGGLAAGMSREEINGHFDEIASFSELGDAIDAPMRTYSSGMFARLAFSVAATVRPDILIIDEALSTDPDFVMGHVLRAEVLITMWERSVLPKVHESLQRLQALHDRSTDRERAHAQAIARWAQGD